MEHTINDMLQAKETLSQQMTALLNKFVDTYDISSVSLDARDERILGNKAYYVDITVLFH